jgi:hypothetical protein
MASTVAAYPNSSAASNGKKLQFSARQNLQLICHFATCHRHQIEEVLDLVSFIALLLLLFGVRS